MWTGEHNNLVTGPTL